MHACSTMIAFVIPWTNILDFHAHLLRNLMSTLKYFLENNVGNITPSYKRVSKLGLLDDYTFYTLTRETSRTGNFLNYLLAILL